MMRQCDIRGQSVRRAILAAVQACIDHDMPLPRYSELGAAIGICASQVSRHVNRLMDDGAFTLTQRGRRVFAESV